MKNIALVVLFVLGLSNCTTVPITGRSQLSLLPESQLVSMSLEQYSAFMQQEEILPPSDSRVKMVREVGSKISSAVERYLKNNDMSDLAETFVWEFNVAKSEVANAWCMAGGKVMFYTGILPICDGPEGVAVVMGHEIAHAVARHGNERMSQALLTQLGGVALSVALSEKPEATQNLFLASYGVGTQLGTLKYSRTHESEADKLGLVFMAMAGYDPGYAVDFWQRMAEQGGARPPEFLSTHPDPETRIQDIKDYLPEARSYSAM